MIDTAEKRKSVAGIAFFLFLGVTPNATEDQEWRQQAGYGYSGILAAEFVEPPEPVVPPPTPETPPPQFAGWENTYLHATQTLGGQGPVGSGSPGGTTWQASTAPAGAFNNTYLHDIRILGGMGPIGAGSPGGTVWEVTP